MKVYRVTREGGEERPAYRPTLDEAHAYVKTNINKTFFPNVVVAELDVETDKAGIVAALNGEPTFTPGRTWGITPRGGLKEEK